MIDFSKILLRSQRNIDKSVFYTEEDSQSLYYLIRDYFLTHPNAKNEDAVEYFQKLFISINEQIVRLPTIRSESIRYSIAKRVLENPQELYEEVKKMRQDGSFKASNGVTKQSYSSERSSAIKSLAIEVLNVLESTKNDISEEEKEIIKQYIKATPKARNAYRKQITSQQRRTISMLAEVFGGTEDEQLIKTLERELPYLGEDLKNNYIKSLMFIGNTLKEFKLLDKYCRDQKKLYSRFGSQYVALTYSKEETEDFFKKANLERLSETQLSMLNAFWINRFCKEIETMNRMFFIVYKHDLWDQIRSSESNGESGIIKVDIDEEQLRKTYERMNVLHEITRMIFRRAEKSQKQVRDSKTGLVRVDINEDIRSVVQELEPEYHLYFDPQTPLKESRLEEDIEKYRVLENTLLSTYKLKDANLIGILASLSEARYVKNWGIILEAEDDSRRKLLLGVDIEGLNMPLRLHIDEDIVYDFIKANQGTSLIPIYDGDKDFMFQGRNIGAQVMLPLDTPRRKAIEEFQKNPIGYTSTKNFISHLAFLANYNNYPEHLKVEKVKVKKGKAKVSKEIPPRRYFDLDTGAIYIKNKDGKFEKTTETPEKGGGLDARN